MPTNQPTNKINGLDIVAHMHKVGKVTGGTVYQPTTELRGKLYVDVELLAPECREMARRLKYEQDQGKKM